MNGASAPFPFPTRERPTMHWQTTRFRIDLSQPRVMGIVNVTPDSFSDGGRLGADAIRHCEQLVAEGQVYYTAPDVKIKGDRAQYDYPTDTITITGDVILSRGNEGVVRGTQVVYKVGEGRSVITAGKNRVTTILVPASKQKPADGATTTPAPATPAPASRPN